MQIFKNLLKYIVNIPWVWNILQNIVGANQWKWRMYPSVFEDKSGKLLDFGCSSGNTTAVFSDFDYVGVDVDAEAIESAKKKYTSHKNIRFYCVNILENSVPEAPFDNILFAAAGHHFCDKDLIAVMDKLVSCLKPGGHIRFFDIFRKPGIDGFTTRMLIRFDQGKFIRTLDEYNNLFDGRYHVADKKIFPSPNDWFIKQEDFVYMKIKAK